MRASKRLNVWGRNNNKNSNSGRNNNSRERKKPSQSQNARECCVHKIRVSFTERYKIRYVCLVWSKKSLWWSSRNEREIVFSYFFNRNLFLTLINSKNNCKKIFPVLTGSQYTTIIKYIFSGVLCRDVCRGNLLPSTPLQW